MDFLTDENIAVSVVRFLRSKGHSVKDVKEDKLFGKPDMDILAIAVKENRIIITHDKDFVNISHNKTVGHKGIILIRLLNQSPSNVIAKLEILFKKEEDRIKHSVITIREDYIEMESKF